MSNREPKPFLTAEWKHLAMLNYEVEPSILAPFVPAGTELDEWNGKTFVSMVGFLFLRTRVLGFPIPFHQDFEEVNLRFYVRRRAEDGWRRGVVFIRELVPRLAIAWVARRFYHEPYLALPMAHTLVGLPGPVRSARYQWWFRDRNNSLQLDVAGAPEPLREGSEAEFITEHYWGYNRQPDGSTLEYRVEHPRWQVGPAVRARLDCDVTALYGPEFQDCLEREPSSAFLAEGSAVTVYRGGRVTKV